MQRSNYFGKVNRIFDNENGRNFVDGSKLNSLLYLRDLDMSTHQVPNCKEFVVYIFKKSKSMRVLRQYQCRCDVRDPAKFSNLQFDNLDQQEQVPANENKTIKKLIENGSVPDVPLELFSDERVACGKVFGSLSKFYAHLRIHSNEKPFVCPVDGCGVDFNQKGNMY